MLQRLVASRRGPVYRSGHGSRVYPQYPPMDCGQHDDGDFTTGQVLLILDVLVSGHEQVEAILFGSVQEISVFEFGPALLPCSSDLMTG